jgi:hypothetical protein
VSPSVGLVRLPCRSHYFIDSGRVQWLAPEDQDAVILDEAESAELSAWGRWIDWWKGVFKAREATEPGDHRG